MRPLKLALALLMTTGLAAVGCSASVDASDPTADGEDELTSAAWQKLTGSYDLAQGDGTPPTIDHLVLTSKAEHGGHHFFADVDTGIRCFRAPCPSNARVEGYFTATSKTVRLTAVGNDGVGLSGRYSYKLAGDKLTLTRGNDNVKLDKSDGTYCTAASDCEGQAYMHPMCVGHATCTPSQTCGYACGSPGNQCPQLSPPSPNFCPNGVIVPRVGSNGCPTGLDCNVRCGNSTCGTGMVCCNPLMGICTPPGGVCIQ